MDIGAPKTSERAEPQQARAARVAGGRAPGRHVSSSAMGDQTLPSLLAGLCCLVMWAPIAALPAWGAGRRMRAVEEADGIRAEPAHEGALLWYAVSSIAWPFAFGLAVVGLARRPWVRVGRGSTLILLAHFTFVMLAVLGLRIATSERREDPVHIAVMVCAIVVACGLLFATFAWRWSGARAARLAAAPPAGGGLGGARFALYAGTLLVALIGLLAPFVLTKPEDAHAAKVAFRIALVHLMAIVLGVCIALPVLVWRFA